MKSPQSAIAKTFRQSCRHQYSGYQSGLPTHGICSQHIKLIIYSARIGPIALYLFLIGIVSLTGCTKPESLGPGDTFPAFSAEDLSGETVVVPAQFTADMRLISIRTLGCRFCKSDFAEMAKLYQYYSRDKLDIFVINVGFEKKNVADFLRDKTVSFTVLVDKAMESMKLTKTTILPVVYLIDSRDIIMARIQGSFSFEEIKYEIDSFTEKSRREKNSL